MIISPKIIEEHVSDIPRQKVVENLSKFLRYLEHLLCRPVMMPAAKVRFMIIASRMISFSYYVVRLSIDWFILWDSPL